MNGVRIRMNCVEDIKDGVEDMNEWCRGYE